MTTHAIEVRVSLPGGDPLGVLTVYLRSPVALEDVQLVWRSGRAPWLQLEAGEATMVVIGGASSPALTVVHTPPVILPACRPVSVEILPDTPPLCAVGRRAYERRMALRAAVEQG